MRPMKRIAWGLVVAVLVAAGASCMDPVTAVNVQGCVKKNCGEAEAVGYQQCEAACRDKYGK